MGWTGKAQQLPWEPQLEGEGGAGKGAERALVTPDSGLPGGEVGVTAGTGWPQGCLQSEE